MISLIGTAISGLFSIGKSYMEERREVKKAKHERQIKQNRSVWRLLNKIIMPYNL